MKKIFLENDLLKKGEIVDIIDEQFHHLANVLRVKTGEQFIIGDKENNEFVGVINKIEKKSLSIELIDYHYRVDLHYPEISLFFPLLKGDRSDDIIKKCCEIGVDNFIPVISKNSVIKIDEENSEKKLKKWQTIAIESSMQCGRLKIPNILPVTKIGDIEKYTDGNFKIVGLIEKNSKNLINTLNENKNFDKISLLIGPEGDFTKDEVEYLKKNNWHGAKLVNNVLRSETATFFITSSLFFYFGRGFNG